MKLYKVIWTYPESSNSILGAYNYKSKERLFSNKEAAQSFLEKINSSSDVIGFSIPAQIVGVEVE